MKILIISSFLPFPLFSGGHVRLYNLIKEVSKNNEVTLICETRPSQSMDDIGEMEKICQKVVTVQRKKQWSLQNILKSAFSKHSFLVNGHTHKEFQEHIRKELQNGNYDLIHVETYYVMQNLPPTSIPVVLAEHNIEYMVYHKFTDRAPLLLKPFLSRDVNKIKKEEEECWRKANQLIAVSNADKEVMEQKGVSPAIVANGVDIEKFNFKLRAENLKNKKILFIGDFKWIQNRDAAKFIITEIWPKIEMKSDIALWIVGRSIPASIRNLTNDKSVLIDEEAALWPTEKIFQAADMLLAPIRVGGGTSYKILESMSCGTPVVTTTLSAESIEARDGVEVLVGDTPSQLVSHIESLLSDRKLYAEVSKNGRGFIEQNYTWGKIAKNLENTYRSVL